MTGPIRNLLCGLLSAAAALCSGASFAAAPQQKTPTPGWYRVMVGDIEVTALGDGVSQLEPKKLLTNVRPERVDEQLRRAYESDSVATSVNGYLVNTGGRLVLVDAGAGTLFGPTLGRLAASLRASGYRPEQVDEVVITHMHPDHVGGLAKDGKRVFVNATVRADRRDADFWLSAATLAGAGDDKPFVEGAQASLRPYVQAGRFRPFDGATEIAAGVRALPAYGHTPGHTVYAVESNGRRLLLIGDLIHVAAVQLADPEVTIAFDSDAQAAAKERARIFADAARDGDWIGAAHFAFPGIGRLKVEDKGYRFVPVGPGALP